MAQMSEAIIFIFIHHKGSDKNNINSKEKQNNLTKQLNRVTCKFLEEFIIPFIAVAEIMMKYCI